MKLKKEFLTKDMGEGQVMISVNQDLFSGVVTSNSTAAFIIDCLKKETTTQKIVDSLCDVYDVSEQVAEKDVLAIIEKLRAINAIEE